MSELLTLEAPTEPKPFLDRLHRRLQFDKTKLTEQQRSELTILEKAYQQHGLGDAKIGGNLLSVAATLIEGKEPYCSELRKIMADAGERVQQQQMKREIVAEVLGEREKYRPLVLAALAEQVAKPTAPPAPSAPTTPQETAEAEWNTDESLHRKFSSKERFVHARVAELSGRLRQYGSGHRR